MKNVLSKTTIIFAETVTINIPASMVSHLLNVKSLISLVRNSSALNYLKLYCMATDRVSIRAKFRVSARTATI